MKTKLIILLITITPFLGLSQTEVSTIDKSVQEIKAKQSSFKRVEKVNTNEGSRFVFLQDKELKLITVKTVDSGMEKNVEWYFLNGELAYCETNWIDTKTKNISFTEKCYLNKGQLISWANSKEKIIDPTSEIFQKMGAELTAYGIKLRGDALK